MNYTDEVNQAGVVNAGGDIIANNVAGLPNPYPGLRAFTFSDRAAYRGREKMIEEAITKLTATDSPRSLLMITGASGSGKTSFVKAGVLPALVDLYGEQGKRPAWALVHPGDEPLQSLAEAIELLNLSDTAQSLAQMPDLADFVRDLATSNYYKQVNLLVIDPLEGLFLRSEPKQRRWMLSFLSNLLPFPQLQAHIIAVVRSDFLSEPNQFPSLPGRRDM